MFDLKFVANIYSGFFSRYVFVKMSIRRCLSVTNSILLQPITGHLQIQYIIKMIRHEMNSINKIFTLFFY